jgi:hypothetical protein
MTRLLVALWMAGFAEQAMAAESSVTSLPRAVEAYEQLEFERCIELLSGVNADAPVMERAGVAEALVYRGTCHFNLAQPASAKSDFKLALELDAAVQLPSGVSPKANELFESARREVISAKVLQPAPPVDPSPPAFVPSVAAATTQQQPRSYLGPLVLGGVSLVSVGLAGYFGLQARRYEGAANGAGFVSDAHRFAGAAGSSATAANVAWICAGTAMVTAVGWWAFTRFAD